jgi:hypothetical protein
MKRAARFRHDPRIVKMHPRAFDAPASERFR